MCYTACPPRSERRSSTMLQCINGEVHRKEDESVPEVGKPGFRWYRREVKNKVPKKMPA